MALWLFCSISHRPHCSFLLPIITFTSSSSSSFASLFSSLILYSLFLKMDNFFSPLSTDSTTINDDSSKQKMGSSQNSQLSNITSDSNMSVMSHPSANNCPLYPFCFCQNHIENHHQRSRELQTNVDRRVVDAYRTKVARSKRKLVRQKSLISRNPPLSCPNKSKKFTVNGGKNSQESKSSNEKDVYTLCTPDNKKLRVLLKKELKNSDVGGLGRIVLPKREAEENLPILENKDGIQVVIRDVYSYQQWSLKFKFWSNNKSRMYVLENTGDFVKQNGLEIGDSLILYEDESKHLYFSVKKVEREEAMREGGGDHEEEASLAILIEQLKHKEQQENNLLTLSMELKNTYTNTNTPLLFNNHNHNIIPSTTANSSDHHNMVDDCYIELGLLPDVNWYNFSL